MKASNTDAEDRFGESVAINGDRIVIGAFGEASSAIGLNGNQTDDSALAAGAAYLFERVAGSWSQTNYLKASNTGGADSFGISVAISSEDLAIGASREDSNARGIDGDSSDNTSNDSGAVYVFGTSYYVSLNVTGLAAGSSLELQNNATDDLILSANGSFTFATSWPMGRLIR